MTLGFWMSTSIRLLHSLPGESRNLTPSRIRRLPCKAPARRAPYIKLYLNTSGQTNINISYNLRDVDGTLDNAIQPVALQFRVGSSGAFTNVPAGFVADATT